MSLIGVMGSPFFWDGLVSLGVWISCSVLGFSSVALGCCFWASVVAVIAEVLVSAGSLLSPGSLAAAGANGLPVPAGGFWAWDAVVLGLCWASALWRGLCWLAGVWWRGEPAGWCFGEGWGTSSGGSSRPPPDMSRWVWQLRHSHSFFCDTQGATKKKVLSSSFFPSFFKHRGFRQRFHPTSSSSLVKKTVLKSHFWFYRSYPNLFGCAFAFKKVVPMCQGSNINLGGKKIDVGYYTEVVGLN